MTMHPDESQEPQEEKLRDGRSRPSHTGPTFAEPAPLTLDLSTEIVKVIPRARDERVTCRWISGCNYRCNWWGPNATGGYDNPGMGGLTVTTHRVRRSRWLRVVKTSDGLMIESA